MVIEAEPGHGITVQIIIKRTASGGGALLIDTGEIDIRAGYAWKALPGREIVAWDYQLDAVEFHSFISKREVNAP